MKRLLPLVCLAFALCLTSCEKGEEVLPVEEVSSIDQDIDYMASKRRRSIDQDIDYMASKRRRSIDQDIDYMASKRRR